MAQLLAFLTYLWLYFPQNRTQKREHEMGNRNFAILRCRDLPEPGKYHVSVMAAFPDHRKLMRKGNNIYYGFSVRRRLLDEHTSLKTIRETLEQWDSNRDDGRVYSEIPLFSKSTGRTIMKQCRLSTEWSLIDLAGKIELSSITPKQA